MGFAEVTAERWLIRGARVVDPANGIDRVADLHIRDGLVAKVGEVPTSLGDRVIDGQGLVAVPGLIDLHVHLRDPGYEHKETMATGTAAAVAGGFTAVCCMPNTWPALDRPERLRDLITRAQQEALARVFPIATISLERAGREAVDFQACVEAGAIGFSDDGDSTVNSGLMRAALEASCILNRPVMVHCEDKTLASGSMHEGDQSRALGLSGIPPEAEEIIIARDLLLARLTGGWLHVCHVSTGRGIAMIRQAKAEGVRVTAEVMPHHLLMSDEWVSGSRQLHNVDEPAGCGTLPRDAMTRVNPPLRGREDTRALVEALRDGDFDVIATDHAPHTIEEKGVGFGEAPPGLSGLEFALPLGLALVRVGHLTMSALVRRLSCEPARILGLPFGTLTPGSPADMTLFDPDETWTVTAEILQTKSPNTPLLGMTLRGRVRLTLVGGEERFLA